MLLISLFGGQSRKKIAELSGLHTHTRSLKLSCNKRNDLREDVYELHLILSMT